MADLASLAAGDQFAFVVLEHAAFQQRVGLGLLCCDFGGIGCHSQHANPRVDIRAAAGVRVGCCTRAMTSRPLIPSTFTAGRALAIAYVVGFGLSTLSAVVVLVAPPTEGDAATASSAWVGYVLQLLLAVAAGAYGLRAAGRFGVDDVALGLRAGPGVSRQRQVAATVVYVAVLAGAAWVTVRGLDLAGVGAPAAGAGVTAQLGAELFHGATAGLVEEFVLLAVPLALARRCGWSTPATIAVLVVTRLGIHLYLGWHALFVIPWLAAAVLLWRRCPSVWPFVVGHGVYDVIQLLVPSYVDGATAFALLLAVLAAATWVLSGFAFTGPRWLYEPLEASAPSGRSPGNFGAAQSAGRSTVLLCGETR